MTETIEVAGEKHEIEVRPITLICQSANMTAYKINYPERVPLDCESTMYHAERVQKLHADFETAWKFFYSNTSNPGDFPAVTDEIRKMGSGVKHLMGLIDLTLKLADKKVPAVWIYPESFMHPGWQVALADLAVWFTRRNECQT